MNEIKRVQQAITELKNGNMIILTDHPDRENEGDLIMPAEIIHSTAMNFLIRNGTGIVCLSLTRAHLQQLNLPLMVSEKENTSFKGTPFTISIDAKNGITTGVSAEDRTITVKAAMTAESNNIVKPGHIFPLQAVDAGVLQRQGHTEGAIDIVRLAGFKPASVICEVMNADGSMTRGRKLASFAKKHKLFCLSINDILTYRYNTENLIVDSASTTVPLENYGTFEMLVVKEKITQAEHIVLIKNVAKMKQPLLVRIHSACTSGDLFNSKRCDCNKELHYSLKQISKEGGMLIYLHQEGRGIGLLNKIKAYELQDKGFDTVEANQQLGLPVDSRQYYIAANILRNQGISRIRLLTNNPDKKHDLIKFGIPDVKIIPMPVFFNEHNYTYLVTKKEKLHHMINI